MVPKHRYTVYGETEAPARPVRTPLCWTGGLEQAIGYSAGPAHEDWGAAYRRFVVHDADAGADIHTSYV